LGYSVDRERDTGPGISAGIQVTERSDVRWLAPIDYEITEAENGKEDRTPFRQDGSDFDQGAILGTLPVA
jgi:hypothetical protein